MPNHDDSVGGLDTPPVGNDETLVRQIKPGTNPLFFDDSRYPLPVLHWSLFKPAPGDQDGLSLIRLRLRSDVWAAFRPTTQDQRYRLARLFPAKLIECGRASGLEWLHFQPSADDLDDEHGQPWAHCVVSEINARDYNDKSDPESKKRILTWAGLVAKQVSRDDVTGPYERPVPGIDPYRPAPA